MSESDKCSNPTTPETMTIAGREFRIGAVYEGKRRSIQRTFLGPFTSLRGWVHYNGPQGHNHITPHAWARWAGKEIRNAE